MMRLCECARFRVLPLVLLMAIPCHQFEVYWNIPSKICLKKGVQIDLDKYGIIHNKDHELVGKNMVILYENRFGTMPRFEDVTNASTAVFGGLPQLLNLESHLIKVRSDIIATIEDPYFNGLAVIDYEYWCPFYSMNHSSKRIYREQSKALVRKKHPDWTEKQVEAEARKEFDAAGSKFFIETLRLAVKLRPYGKWGYYGFPLCNFDAGVKGEWECNNDQKRFNNELKVVLQEGTAMFPGAYLHNGPNTTLNFRYIYAILSESKRVNSMLTEEKPIYPYTMFEYDPFETPWLFYEQTDLCNTVRQMADFGMQGAVAWTTTSALYRRCENISNYIDAIYGPFVMHLKHQFDHCAADICLGKERCTLRTVDKTQCYLEFEQSKYRCIGDDNT